VEVALTKTT